MKYLRENAPGDSGPGVGAAQRELMRNLVRIEGQRAATRAMAWARSAPGTPYGETEVAPDPRAGSMEERHAPGHD
jgi:hypothetical protein